MSTLFFVIPSRIDFLYSIKSHDEQDEEAEGAEQEGKVLLPSDYSHRILCYQFKPGLKPELLVHLFYKEGEKQEKKKKLKGTPTLLNWKVVHDRMPWNIVLLLGGGFALASGSEVRGCTFCTCISILWNYS